MTNRNTKNKSFIEKACGRDEKMIMVARMHWFFLLIGFCWFVLFFSLGIGLDSLIWRYLESNIPPYEREALGVQFHSRGNVLKWALVGTGVLFFLYHLIGYATTKVGLTDKRLLLRTGLIFVRVEEIDLEEIKSEHVDHGAFGRFFNYGRVIFDARFVGDVPIPHIARPYLLLRATHEARAALADSLAFSPTPRSGADEELVKETDEYRIYKKRRA